MTLSSAEELRELRSVVRSLFDKQSAEPEVRLAMESDRGYDADLWRTMAQAIGLQGLTVPEEYGGAGAGPVELGVVMEELGRALVCAPYLATVALGVTTLTRSGATALCHAWLPRVAQGEAILTAALTGRRRRTHHDVAVSARRSADQWLLSGTETHVLDAAVADAILVLARHDDGVALFMVERGEPGLTVTPRRTSDLTRRFATMNLDEVCATPVGRLDDGLELARQAVEAATAALAHEQAGGAAAVLDQAVDYARTRHQFGRPIGSFQAVKHRCANMLVSVESARSAAWATSRALVADEPDVPLVAAIAGAVCGEAYISCASDNVQVHGGIGFTWEHSAHLHVKRSRGSAVLFGTPQELRSTITDLVPVLPTPQGVAR